MAIYQAPRKRWRLAVITGAIGAVVGLLVGLTLSGGGGDDPMKAIRALDASLDEAAAPLDVLVIHGEADTGSADNARVVLDAVTRTESRFDVVRDGVRAIDPTAIDEFERRVAKLRDLADERADADEIAEEASSLAAFLRDLVRT